MSVKKKEDRRGKHKRLHKTIDYEDDMIGFIISIEKDFEKKQAKEATKIDKKIRTLKSLFKLKRERVQQEYQEKLKDLALHQSILQNIIDKMEVYKNGKSR